MRLFVAVWPPAAVLDAIEALHRPVDGGGRWTRRDQWHVTLRFLGDADPEEVAAALATVDARPAEAVLGPAVGLLGRGVVQVPVAGLDAVAAAVVAATGHLGRPPEDRPFRGHLTLARIAGRPPDAVLGQPCAGRFAVDAVHLVSSTLGGDAARYETLASVRLA